MSRQIANTNFHFESSSIIELLLKFLRSATSDYSALGSDPWAQLSFGESDLPDQVTSLIGYPVNVCELDSHGRNCRVSVGRILIFNSLLRTIRIARSLLK